MYSHPLKHCFVGWLVKHPVPSLNYTDSNLSNNRAIISSNHLITSSFISPFLPSLFFTCPISHCWITWHEVNKWKEWFHEECSLAMLSVEIIRIKKRFLTSFRCLYNLIKFQRSEHKTETPRILSMSACLLRCVQACTCTCMFTLIKDITRGCLFILNNELQCTTKSDVYMKQPGLD